MLRPLTWAALSGALWLGLGWAHAGEPGTAAPAFRLTSGDGRDFSAEQASNVIVIDPEGVIRYRRAGDMTRADREAVFELLK